MRKDFNQNDVRERSGLRTVAAISLSMSLAAFGCSTNNTTAAPAAAPSTASSSNQSSPVDASQSLTPSSVDAVAVLKADEAYRGKVLGTVNPGGSTQTTSGATIQQPTGQYVSPAASASPQPTVNSSISSAPVPAVTSGAGEAVAATGVTPPSGTAGATRVRTGSPSTFTNANAGVSGVSNVGANGISNTTATGVTGAATGTTATGVRGLKVTNAGTGSATNTTATAVTPSINGSAASGTARRASVRPVKTAKAVSKATPASTSTKAAPGVSVRAVTNADGSVTVTNAQPTRFQRVMRALGLRSNAVAGGPQTIDPSAPQPSTNTTTNPNQ